MRLSVRMPTRSQLARAALLAAILATVALVTYHPHWNPVTGRSYRYPVHMDEYVHWGYAQAIVEQGNVTFRNPFTGDLGGDFSVEAHLHERGYQAYLGVFQAVTGIPWLPFFQYGPVVITLFLALTLYVVCAKWGAGPEAALLVACIPTTLRFLGPGFMVPIVFSLPLVAVGLYCLFHTRKWGGLVAFALLAAGLWPIHVIGAFALFALGVLYAAFIAASEPRRAAVVLAMAALPFLAAWEFYAWLFDRGVLTMPFLPADERILLYFGVIPLVAAAVGAAVLLYARRGRDFAAGGALGVGLLLTEGVILWRLFYGEDPFILYDRAFMLLYLQASILGAVGLAFLRRWLLKVPTRVAAVRARPRLARAFPTGVLLAAVIVAATMVGASAKPQLEQPFYVILSDREYRAFSEAGLTLNATYGRAVVEGIPTMPFTILTGLPTLYVHFPSSPGADPAYLQDFWSAGANDTYLLVQNGVTVVVSKRALDNPDLVPIGDGVYVLRWDYASRMAHGLRE